MVPYREESIVQNLKDAGCDENIIKAFLYDLQVGNKFQADQLLNKQRSNLLTELHEDQRRIDCLDYLVFMLRRLKNNKVQN